MLSVNGTKPPSTEVSCSAAILLYQNGNSVRYGSYHEVKSTGKDLTIGAGTPLSKRRIISAIRDLAGGEHEDVFVSDNVVAKASGLIAWWRPAQNTRLWFHCAGLDEARGKKPTAKPTSATVPVPPLLFAAYQGMLFVFALAVNERPTANAALMFSPFMNIYEDGNMCSGSVKLPSECTSSSIPAWEKAFFGSKFSHFNGADHFKYTGGRMQFAADWVDGKFAEFPMDVLTPKKQTLAQFFKSILKSKTNE